MIKQTANKNIDSRQTPNKSHTSFQLTPLSLRDYHTLTACLLSVRCQVYRCQVSVFSGVKEKKGTNTRTLTNHFFMASTKDDDIAVTSPDRADKIVFI